MKKKRVNPHRRPATLADVQKAKKAAQNEAVTTAWAIFFSALRDKEGFGYTRLRRVWDEVNYLAGQRFQGLCVDRRSRKGTRRLRNHVEVGL